MAWKDVAWKLLAKMGVAGAGAGAIATGAEPISMAALIALAGELIELLSPETRERIDIDALMNRLEAQAGHDAEPSLRAILLAASEHVAEEYRARLTAVARATSDEGDVGDRDLLVRAVRELFGKTGVTDDPAELEERLPARVSLSKLPKTDPHLFGRTKELRLLSNAWRSKRTHVLALISFGGVGKTALVKAWLNRMERQRFRGAQRVFGWTFYSGVSGADAQASAERFIAEALRWFGDPNPNGGSPWGKGRRLAELVRKRRTLLILDGLEPLQYPPGKGMPAGRLKDRGVAALLGELAWGSGGLCIVTSRLEVEDLKDSVGTTVRQVQLEHLSDQAGAELLEALGAKGTPTERQRVSREFGGHALALNLLGKYLAGAYHGDIRRRHTIPALTEEPTQGGHARRVMRAYERWLADRPELSILEVASLFDGPADPEAVQAVLSPPEVRGLTSCLVALPSEEWSFCVARLREMRLLLPPDPLRRDELDCHPLVREHFARKLQTESPRGWKNAHKRLYVFYKAFPDNDSPTLEDLSPLYAAIRHGCEAGRCQEALDGVFIGRIQRGAAFLSAYELGAFGMDLASLACFFRHQWDRPAIKLSPLAQAFVSRQVGYCLRSLGRFEEAVVPLKRALADYASWQRWQDAADCASLLSRVYMMLGRLKLSREHAERSVAHAVRTGDASSRAAKLRVLADVLHQLGSLREAETLFLEAEGLPARRPPRASLLHDTQPYSFCDLLLSQGRYTEARKLASRSIRRAAHSGWLVYMGTSRLALSRALMVEAQHGPSARLARSAACLTKAVDSIRKSAYEADLCLALLTKAALCRLREEFSGSWRDLQEAELIAGRGTMRLYQADCHLEAARLHLAQREAEKARKRLERAEAMVRETGYALRQPEVHLETARLLLLERRTAEARRRFRKGRKLIEEMGLHRWDPDVQEIGGQLP